METPQTPTWSLDEIERMVGELNLPPQALQVAVKGAEKLGPRLLQMLSHNTADKTVNVMGTLVDTSQSMQGHSAAVQQALGDMHRELSTTELAGHMLLCVSQMDGRVLTPFGRVRSLVIPELPGFMGRTPLYDRVVELILATQLMAGWLRGMGIPACTTVAIMSDGMPDGEQQFELDEVHALVTAVLAHPDLNNVIGIGFEHPGVDMCGLFSAMGVPDKHIHNGGFTADTIKKLIAAMTQELVRSTRTSQSVHYAQGHAGVYPGFGPESEAGARGPNGTLRMQPGEFPE